MKAVIKRGKGRKERQGEQRKGGVDISWNNKDRRLASDAGSRHPRGAHFCCKATNCPLLPGPGTKGPYVLSRRLVTMKS